MSEKKAELIDYNIGQCNFCFIECINHLHKKRLANFFQELGFMIEFGLENIPNILDLDCDKLIIISFSENWKLYNEHIRYNIRLVNDKTYLIIENVGQSNDFVLKSESIKKLKPFIFHKILKKEEEIINILYKEFNLSNKSFNK